VASWLLLVPLDHYTAVNEGTTMNGNTNDRSVDTRWVESGEFRKSLDSFEVPPPVVVEVPVMVVNSTPQPTPPAPTDYDG
jgi:hypothetical protein